LSRPPESPESREPLVPVVNAKRLAFGVACCVAVVWLSACQGVPRSTRLNNADFNHMAAAMAQSLLGSEAVRERGPESPKWLISIESVRNLSSDVLTPADQWAVMYQIKDAQPIRQLWETRNIRFVLPPERIRQIRKEGFDAKKPFVAEREVTHTLTATFRSATRAQARSRTEVYYAQFVLMNLRTGRPVWADRVEFKRFARGHIWD